MVAMRTSSLLLGAGALVAAAPANLDARAGCTFSDAAAAIAGKASCAAIVIKDMTVPAGTTLDLTKLKTGTTVRLSFMWTSWLLMVNRLPSRARLPLDTRSGKAR
jgi:hypothetical protein